MGNYLLQLLVNIEKRHPLSMLFILGIVLVKACVFTFQKASHMYHGESKLLAITATAASEYNCATITTTDDDVMNKSLLCRQSGDDIIIIIISISFMDRIIIIYITTDHRFHHIYILYKNK